MQRVPLDVDVDLAKAIQEALPTDPNIGEYLEILRNPELPREEDVQEFLEPFSMQDNLVLYDGLVYIPENDALKLQVLQQCHDSPTAGHLGQAKTFELVSRDYHWPGMREFIIKYSARATSAPETKLLATSAMVSCTLYQSPQRPGPLSQWISSSNSRNLTDSTPS